MSKDKIKNPDVAKESDLSGTESVNTDRKIIAQNTEQAETILANPLPRKELTPAEIEYNRLKAEMKAKEEEIKLQKAAILQEIKNRQNALKQEKEENKRKADELKAAVKAEKKAKKTEGSDSERFTRVEALGETMKAHPTATPDEIIQWADDLYSQTEGKKSNLKETKAAYNFAIRFLKGFNGIE